MNQEENSNKIYSNPQHAEEYTTDIIESLLEEEDYYFNKKKYINPYYLENEDSELTPEMRTIVVDWLVLIHSKIFKFQENTLFLTIQIFDRYLSKIDLNTEKTELLLLSSFMLASKHNEIDYVNMQETLQLAQNKFTKEQVIEMESEILDKMEFEILAPTMCEYFTLFASFLNLSEAKINHGFYVLNIVLVDFHMLEYPNFILALAVVKLITKKFNKKLMNLVKNILIENKMDNFLEYFEGENYEEIYDICNKIKLLYNTFLETKYKNIQEKFSDDKYNKVSIYTDI
jgi:cyclin B